MNPLPQEMGNIELRQQNKLSAFEAEIPSAKTVISLLP